MNAPSSRTWLPPFAARDCASSGTGTPASASASASRDAHRAA
ncbi:sulfonate ABC transporter ATP-binding protein, partial [Bacillus sp. AFS075960]